ncbi:MAG: S8 family serine peptidase [Bacteroidales bacterium]
MVKARLHASRWLIAFSVSLFAILQGSQAYCQKGTYSYYYRVIFRNKGDYTPSDFQASELMSQRAMDRRSRSGVTYPDYRDLPVYKPYIEQITSMGYTYHCSSKWLNTGLFKSTGLLDFALLRNLPYVSDVLLVKTPANRKSVTDKLKITGMQAELPPYDRPLTMTNGNLLHSSGLTGKGVFIAVLDGGFYKADLVSSLDHLRKRGGIKGTYDFVYGKKDVYNYHNHGTAVLSVLAGLYENHLEGTAPDADYLLLRSEDTSTEYSVEEDFWVAAAEFADSAGVDIISSSLGYYEFDDPELNYKYSDMDGNTTFVSRGADVAASKGILVLASAGNERNKSWKRIIAPSDGDSVLCIGAVDGNLVISDFSSAGPAADGRVKPDISAQGVLVTIQTEENTLTRANGTSFSCPVMSGLCACLLQSVPNATNMEISRLLKESSNRFQQPDSLYGYGIPDMVSVLKKLQDKYVVKSEDNIIIGPNPFTEAFNVVFKEDPGDFTLEILSGSGKIIRSRSYTGFKGRTINLYDLAGSLDGLYYYRVRTSKGTFSGKIIKTSSL